MRCRDTAVPFVMGDRSELHRLPVNLFINATEAMPDGGRILVRVRLTTLRLVVGGLSKAETDATPALQIGITDTGRDFARRRPADLRTRVHYQAAGPGHGPWSGDLSRHCHGARRHDRREDRRRTRDDGAGVPAGDALHKC